MSSQRGSAFTMLRSRDDSSGARPRAWCSDHSNSQRLRICLGFQIFQDLMFFVGWRFPGRCFFRFSGTCAKEGLGCTTLRFGRVVRVVSECIGLFFRLWILSPTLMDCLDMFGRMKGGVKSIIEYQSDLPDHTFVSVPTYMYIIIFTYIYIYILMCIYNNII